MVNKFMKGTLSEEEENFASGFTMMGSIIKGGKQFNSVPDEASIEYNVRPVPSIIMTLLKIYSNKRLMK